MNWILNGFEMRNKYKKFSIEYNRKEKERLAHEMGESHAHETS